MQTAQILVFDVGGTMVKYALMDRNAVIYDIGSIPTVLTSFEAFMYSLLPIYKKFENCIEGVSFSLPGRIDSDKGFVYSAGALSFNYNSNFVEKTKKYFDAPIAIENDGKCAALAEAWIGKLKGVSNGVVVVLGTGIGGGIIINHQLHKGSDFFAGELSYMMSDFKNSSFDHSFAYQAGVKSLIRKVAQAKGVPFESLNGELIFEMLQMNDETVSMYFEEMVKTIAGAIFTIAAVLNPEKVLIGGGISRQPIVLQKIKQELTHIYESLPFEIPHTYIDTCQYFNESNLIGALYHFKTTYKKLGE